MYPETGHPQGRSISATISTLRFNSRIVGNAGAPLHSILSESHEDIEAESSNVEYSNDPMSVMIMSRQGNTVIVGNQEEPRPDEVKSLLLHGDPEEYVQKSRNSRR